jgi:putative ABC transport system substrate-binding protein
MKRTSLPLRRREFIAGLGSTAAWPLAARAQQRERMLRIGLLVSALSADDPEWQVRGTAFVQGLQELGWTDGRNVRIDFRFGLGDADRLRRFATELVALAPDVIVAGGTPALPALQQATRTLPIVFANVQDPVGTGFVASLARPGGNATGFMNVEYGLSTKWLELLKQIAPQVTRGIAGFARGPNDGLIMTAQLGQTQRDPIIALAARYRLPAVYPIRRFVTEGGLISFGPDQTEPYRLAAGYVDRILKGERAADLPVQVPSKYQTVINLKTAKLLGIEVPETLLATADEVIQ